ncbi:MAG: hypothetical protein R3321_00025 [Nitrososphaeraceae archaeon]|nr:hypothetical protein [Nitrososphaeraceae archaeon]
MNANTYYGPLLQYNEYYDVTFSSYLFADIDNFFSFSPQEFFTKDTWERKTRQQRYEAFMYETEIEIKKKVADSLLIRF